MIYRRLMRMRPAKSTGWMRGGPGLPQLCFPQTPTNPHQYGTPDSPLDSLDTAKIARFCPFISIVSDYLCYFDKWCHNASTQLILLYINNVNNVNIVGTSVYTKKIIGQNLSYYPDNQLVMYFTICFRLWFACCAYSLEWYLEQLPLHQYYLFKKLLTFINFSVNYQMLSVF